MGGVTTIGSFLFQLAVLSAGEECESCRFAFPQAKSGIEFGISLVLRDCFTMWASRKRCMLTLFPFVLPLMFYSDPSAVLMG